MEETVVIELKNKEDALLIVKTLVKAKAQNMAVDQQLENVTNEVVKQMLSYATKEEILEILNGGKQ